MSFDSQSVSPNYDPSLDTGDAERFLDSLGECENDEYATSQPELGVRMQSLLDALDHLLV